MSGIIHPHGDLKTASPKTRAKRDSSEQCRERASADLLTSVTMSTANQRLILERSAANWSLRAEMLDGLQRSETDRHIAVQSSARKAADDVRL
jgi:hypothetical protein